MNHFNKKAFVLLTLILTACILTGSFVSGAGVSQKNDTNLSPKLNNGHKWRIAYAETDPFGNFAGTFYGIVQGLEKLGWVTGTKDLPYTKGQADSKGMWDWLTSHDIGPYIEFVKDAHYSFLDAAPDLDQQIIDRLANTKDIDLLIVMGTAVGKKLALERHKVPTMVFSSSNAVQSGIIKSETDSGIPNVWAHMDSNRYKRQIEVFHDIFAFKKLGMMFENSATGRIYAAVDDVKDIAKTRNFTIVEKYVNDPTSDEDKSRYYKEVLAANESLANEVDAMYLSFGTWDLDQLPALLAPFLKKHIPVFSQLGAEEVQYGALMSLNRADFSGIGRFGAENMIRIFNGTPPQQLPQIYGDTPSIVLNLAVADQIGYKVPFDILLAADKIYPAIGGGK